MCEMENKELKSEETNISESPPVTEEAVEKEISQEQKVEAQTEDNQAENVQQDNTQSQEQEDTIEALKKQLEEKEREVEEYKSLCQQIAADFDNYKKRIAKDKENMYYEVVADVIGKLLPIVDNFERAISSAKESENTNEEFLKGLEMIKKQIDDIFSKLGVEPIEALNKEFDPYLHNAIMHVEDERYGKNIVIEEFQKGYKIKDRVIRYSLVKVANAN
ncbi:GrpE protein [Caldicellulosiruptor saccharolyticus DSM 8903]|uniref:Protein GrpE n=1 Tax=Caldicellulosiruptor saccharolyticus (strain ATCC 43494 / DSM 8903 / Tp8T 6331) TaxID=351627 RepID=A4XKA3_CALS8|nr:nucleotide exchange factor GrpE [Caldicellulosiruptor saccharolyticus]ABP67338.1 GrpE protein [Caldicellulosiruptor saccharolyticus DSM 8903]